MPVAAIVDARTKLDRMFASLTTEGVTNTPYADHSW